MNNKMINAIGGIDDKFIDEAAQPARKIKIRVPPMEPGKRY